MAKSGYKQNDNNLAVVYARYSSHSQNEASIEQQLEAAREYARKNGLEIVKEYTDAAMSGRDKNRPGLNLMLAEVKKLKPAHCLLWKGDRLARDKMLAMISKNELKSAGCFPVYITEGLDPQTPEGELLESLLEALSAFYARQAQENIERGMSYNAKHCLSNGAKKYGYITGSDKRYEVNPLEAQIVREIYVRYDRGERPIEIADSLNERGLRTARGKLWRVDSVAKILRNPAYKGVYVWRDHEVEGGMPSIVEKDLWERVAKRRDSHKRHKRQEGKHADYWLTTKLFCGECGEPMSGAYGRSSGNGHEYYYYRCTNKECKMRNVRKEELEKRVSYILGAVLNNADNIADLAASAYAEYLRSKDDGILEGLRAKKREVESKTENYMKAVENGCVTNLITEKLLALDEEREGLMRAIAIEEAKAQVCASEQMVNEHIRRYLDANIDDPSTLKEVFNWYVTELTYGEEGLVARCRYACGVDCRVACDADGLTLVSPWGYVLQIEGIRLLTDEEAAAIEAENERKWMEEVVDKVKKKTGEIAKSSAPDI